MAKSLVDLGVKRVDGLELGQLIEDAIARSVGIIRS